MVKKRALLFATLAMFVWAVLISSLAAYFYLQNVTSNELIAENQQSLNAMSATYNEAMTKYNKLLSDYSTLYGNYSFPYATNFTLLTGLFSELLNNIEGNFSSLLTNQRDLNQTYCTLQTKLQTLLLKGNVTREEFGELLSESYDFLNLLTIRELGNSISEVATLVVNICIDYGNETLEWHNGTKIPPGLSLFQATQKVAAVNHVYYAWMKPGHIRLIAINNKEEYTNYAGSYSEGYAWIWSYWDDNKQNWVPGPVGCDAWMLKNGGIYKWTYSYWRWPP